MQNDLDQYAHKQIIIFCFEVGGGGDGGERGLQGNRWFSPSASMKSCLASVTLKMASKVFIEETAENFEFITEILFRYFGLGGLKILIVIENQTLVLLFNETSSGHGVMNFKDSFLSSGKFPEHLYQPVTLLRAGAQQY